MQLRPVDCRANGRAAARFIRTSLFLIAALGVAACVHADPTVTGSVPVAPSGQTIAFESVDGPPRPIFDRLVSALSAEAETRNLPVVSHTGPAAYRVRAYLATYVEKKKKQATLAWTWEVFDRGMNRAFRLSGEEPLGTARGDIWAQCDDALLRRVAARGFDELAARLGAPAPAPTAPGEPDGPAVASAETPRAIAFTNTQ
jgi:hypothetical protein